MKFDLDRCVHCGLTLRLPYRHSGHGWNQFIGDGKIEPEDPFRFCSDECVHDALVKEFDLKELRISDADNPRLYDFIGDFLQDYRERWYAESAHRASVEEQTQRLKEAEKERARVERERQRELDAEERQHQRLLEAQERERQREQEAEQAEEDIINRLSKL